MIPKLDWTRREWKQFLDAQQEWTPLDTLLLSMLLERLFLAEEALKKANGRS